MILVGPSGCGKSTLLRMIVGLEDITSGDMVIGDKKVNDLAPRDRNLAMVFQNYALYPHLTRLREHRVPAPARQAPTTPTIDKKVREASKTLELDEHLERKPGNLSGGQRQRVAMGRAIVREADAFLFDEPLSNLDAKLRGQMRTEIARLQKRLGITTVYVTHDQTEAMTLGDRVAVLKRGLLQQLATPRELYENPGNLFVAGFIGSPPMNFLPAEVEGTSVKLPFGTVEIPAEKAKRAQGKGLLIAGIRPEHFEDASVMDDADGRARRSRRRSTSSSGWATRPTPTSRSRRRPRSQKQLDAAREGPRRRDDAHPAGHLPRRREPHRGGRRRRDLGQRHEDAPLRPGYRREPHRRPAARHGRRRAGGRRRRRAGPGAGAAAEASATRRRRPRPRRRARSVVSEDASSRPSAAADTVTPPISATPLTRTVGRVGVELRRHLVAGRRTHP